MTPLAAEVALSAQGPRVSPIVAGAWRMADWGMDVPARVRWIEQCLDLGITTFDHADIYGDYTVEALFGQALAAAPALRGRIRLVSKCGIRLLSARRPGHALKSYDTSAAHVLRSVDHSLQALQVDHLDLLLVHRPDALMDPEALAETFRALRDAGKVLHFGVSNHSPGQFALLHRRLPLATNQVELSPLRLDVLHDGTLDQCVDLGVRPMIWSPLAGGRLLRGEDDAARRVMEVLAQLAGELGVAPATVAYAWILRHPSRPVPITGSGRLEGLKEAVAALPVQLSPEQWYRVWQAGKGHEVP